MVDPIAAAVSPSIDLLTFVITAVSVYYVYKQQPSQYPYVKGLLIAVHFLFEGVIILEFLRNFVSPSLTDPNTIFFMDLYTLIASSFILWDVVLLTGIAYSVYFRPGGLGFRGRLKAIFFRRPNGFIFLGFILFTALTDGYLIITTPYSIQHLQTLGGVITTSTAFQPFFLALSVGDLIFFFGYPSSLLILAAGGAKDKAVRNALVILPICWTGIGADLLIVNGFLITLGFDFTYLGYILAAVAFAVTASIFRRASLLSSFFEPVPQVVPVTSPFSKRVATPGVSFEGTRSLLEVDPSSNYEDVVKDFSIEQIPHGALVFVFTSRGSPVFNSLYDRVGVRFYVMTSKVSYPKPTELQNEVLVPQNDQAVLLDLIDKTVVSTAEGKASVIFDSISDLILYLGFEGSYKFIKQANEILSLPKVSGLFLLTSGAHEDKILSLIRSLFPNHLLYDARGLKLTRGGRQAEKPPQDSK
jgi:hypothetical protein